MVKREKSQEKYLELHSNISSNSSGNFYTQLNYLAKVLNEKSFQHFG